MIFAFGPGNNSFYINNGKLSLWENIPESLAKILLDDERAAPEKINSIMLFPGGGYFLAAKDGMWATDNVPATIASRIQTCDGGNASVCAVDFDASVPSCYMMATKTSVTVFHSGLPIGMLHALASDMFSGIKSATVGNNGTWAIITSSGKLVSDLHDPNVHNVLKDGRRIKSMVLSPYNDSHVFAEYTDGTVAYCCPPSWHADIGHILSFTPTTAAVSHGSAPAIAPGGHGNAQVNHGHPPVNHGHPVATEDHRRRSKGFTTFVQAFTKELTKDVVKDVEVDMAKGVVNAVFSN